MPIGPQQFQSVMDFPVSVSRAPYTCRLLRLWLIQRGINPDQAFDDQGVYGIQEAETVFHSVKALSKLTAPLDKSVRRKGCRPDLSILRF